MLSGHEKPREANAVLPSRAAGSQAGPTQNGCFSVALLSDARTDWLTTDA